MQQELPAQERAEAVKARIAQFCGWFDVEPPKLRIRKGEVYLTDEFIAWFRATGASIDWIVLGDVRPMAATVRKQHLEDEKILAPFRQLDEEEQKRFLVFVEEIRDGRPFDEARADMDAWIAEHRAKKH